MKKIPCVFVRDFSVRPHVTTEEVTPGCLWVLAGEGVATVKFDGTAALVDSKGKLWARYDCKKGRTPPEHWHPCDPEPDPVTGHWPGWVGVGDQPQYRWIAEAFRYMTHYEGRPLAEGTYEAVGPKINGNPHRLTQHQLWPHGSAWADAKPPWVERTYASIRTALEYLDAEGIVYHHPDGRMAKIRRADFGLPWPLPEAP